MIDHGYALGVVPVVHDDRSAPAGCSALRTLGGVPLVSHAVGVLMSSGRVERVVVPVPPALRLHVGEVLTASAVTPQGSPPPAGPALVEVVAVQDNGPGARLLAVLADRPLPEDGIVVVHDPLHPLAPAALVEAVVDALRASTGPGAEAGVVPVRPVTDTLKWVDEDDVVTGTADREAFRSVHSPQAFRAGMLLSALRAAPAADLRAAGAEHLPRLVQRVGGRLGTVPAPGGSFRIGDADDLVLAEVLADQGMRC